MFAAPELITRYLGAAIFGPGDLPRFWGRRVRGLGRLSTVGHP
jgi:hypothetical protein